jgi:cytochrome c1
MNTGRSVHGLNKLFLIAVTVLLFPSVLCAREWMAPTTGPDPGNRAIDRGKEVFQTSCQACHSLKYLGYAAKMSVQDAQRAFGISPPDLNLITKARGNGGKGAAYLYALLTGYNDSPEKNSVFPNIAMPSPFPGDDSEASRKAKDVSIFLEYAAEPTAGGRTDLGRYVLGYMVILTALLYALNRKTWKGMMRKTR